MGQTARVHNAGNAEIAAQGQGAASNIGGTKIVERPLEEGPFDEFYVSKEDRKAYGIRDDEKPYWARDPEFWMAHGELRDRVKQLEAPVERGGMNGRLIRTEEFDKVHIGGGTHGDLVLMAIPREQTDAMQAEIDGASKDYQAGLQETDAGWEGHHSTLEWDGLDRRMRAEHEYNQQSGLIGRGSPTQGMTLTQAAAVMRNKQEMVASRQEALRNGGYHATPDLEGFQRLMSGQKRLHGMGNSGFGRNPNSAVAQAARREGKGR